MSLNCLKRIIKKLIFPNTYSSEAYVMHLKKCGGGYRGALLCVES